MLFTTEEIPTENYTVAISNTPMATGNVFLSPIKLLNALKLDAIKSYKDVLTVKNSSVKSVLQNGVDKSSSAFNNAGINPNPVKTDYSMYYIGGGIGVFVLFFAIILFSRKS